MKLRNLTLSLIIVALCTAVWVLPVAAEAPKSYFTGTETEYYPPDLPTVSNEWYNGNFTKLFIYEDAWAIDDVTDNRLDGIEVLHITLVVDTRTWLATFRGDLEIFEFTNGQIGPLRWTGHIAGKGGVVADGFYLLSHASVHGEGPYQGLVAEIDYEGVSNEDINSFSESGYIVNTGASK